MAPRRPSCFFWLVTLFVCASCCALFLGGLALLQLPPRASAVFGPADRGLGAFQQYYLSYKLLAEADKLLKPVDSTASERSFAIGLGESLNSISGRLQSAGVISSPQAFRDYLIYAGLDTTVQAGEHSLSPAMTTIEVARAIQDPTPDKITLNILAGWRLEEIAGSLPASGLHLTPQAFLSAAQNPDRELPLLADLPSGATLEGYLLPGAYTIARNTSASQFVEMALAEFDRQVGPTLRQSFKDQGLSLNQAVILASLVQREAMREDEMPLIASVFTNRLANGMNLDSDPTVQYALGYNDAQKTWWTNPLSAEDLQVYSAYNTYQNPGLPPAPISNPGMAALKAVAQPAQTPYLYFRAACDGSGRHKFADTFEAHLQNGCP